MLTILAKPGRLCDGPSRRDLLTVGGLGLLGLSLPDVLHREAKARERPTPKRSLTGSGNSRADSVILLYLQGSPSHIDTWDPKPNAPVEIRGEFKPAATNVSGVYLSETLPLLAKQADKFALVRSISVKPRGLANHGASIYMIMTAHDPTNFSPTGLAVPPSREDLPSMGSIALRYRPVDAGMLGYVSLCGPIIEGGTPGVGMFAGLLGAMHDPFQMY